MSTSIAGTIMISILNSAQSSSHLTPNSSNLEVDYAADVWADHDENCHGTIDTDEMREVNPEGFVWDCCDKPGDEEGCQRGRHQADPGKSKKRTGDSESDNGISTASEEDYSEVHEKQT